MNGITYSRQGEFNLPNLLPPQETEGQIGKYALLRLEFLKEHRKITYTNLLTTGTLNTHLAEIERTAANRLKLMMKQMSESEGITEELKANAPVKWAGLMNNIRHSAEEIILSELIYS
ncbi:MAG: TnpV protein [[Clostridium] leptum]|uniref:TnpV protein n=1 Tax=Massiliimalia timonensis TaxID=1987501 RepID=UPI000B8B1E21|nr:TnpV protein [Massiliimalia timonensis]